MMHAALQYRYPDPASSPLSSLHAVALMDITPFNKGV
jgi:hypothetical protein